MTRLHYLIILLAVVLIAAYSSWLLTAFKPKQQADQQAVRHEPDYFLEEATATVINAAGLPRYRLKAQKVEHYPDDGSVKLLQPRMRIHRKDKLPPWRITSEQGRILNRGDLIHLDGRVTMIRPASRRYAKAELFTRDLLILPQEEYAETDARVLLKSNGSQLRGKGIRVYLAEGRMELLAEGEGTYVSP